MKEECKYRLPCGRCEKRGASCDAPDVDVKEECEHDWVLTQTQIDSFYAANHYVCSKCGEEKSLPLGV